MCESPGTVTVTIPWPHDPEPGCLPNHCHSHGVDEPDGDAYRVCGECGHVFPTAAHLVADHAALADRLNARPLADPRFPGSPPMLVVAKTDPEQIWVCPNCAHDF